MSEDKTTDRCSFCGKHHTDAGVEVLVEVERGGPAICSECIEIAESILRRHRLGDVLLVCDMPEVAHV